MVAIVDEECQCHCVLLNDDIDSIVRSKLSMRWRYAEAQTTVMLCDGFAVLDHDSKLGGNRQRLDWRERRPSATSRASACRALHHRPLGQYGWCCIGSTPGSTIARSAATARSMSRSFCRGPCRAPLAASRRPNGASCALPSRACGWQRASD
jgi:hypothetical protein